MAENHTGGWDWQTTVAAVVAAIGAGGALRAGSQILDRIFPSGDKRLEARNSQRHDSVEREARLAIENQNLREELQTMTDQWLDAEKRYLDMQSRFVKQEAQIELVRKNAETPAQNLAQEAAEIRDHGPVPSSDTTLE